MIRIAMLSYHTCPLATLGGKSTGGMNVYVRDLTKALGRLGIHVDVFTRSQDEHVPHVLHDLGYGNRVVHIPAGPEVPLTKEELVGFIPTFVEEILKFEKEKNIQYDLIHSHYWMSGLAAIALKEKWNVPLIHMFHTLGEMKNQVAKNPEERESSFRIDCEKKILEKADQIVAATLSERAQLDWFYKANLSKIVVIPPGVDLSHFYPIPVDEAREFVGVKLKDKMVLFVGRIEPLKGIDTLISAMPCLNFMEDLGFCPVTLTIIGGDPDADPEFMTAEMTRLQELSNDLGMDNMVIFLGKRSQDTLPYYYSAADVVVMPSHYESFGLVALEAMACGTPVIASQVGGLTHLVQDGVTGYHVANDDPQELCSKLKLLLGDEERRLRFGKQATRRAQEYSWEVIADQIKSTYSALLQIG
ncbi:MAG TPA: glycosyltransferase [Anaerolineales bacterium]|nr:glycosyltransferase [Anaerolineales bacterium]